MPHKSVISPEKNHTKICHSLCMQHARYKSWRIKKKMTHKNLNIVNKTSSSVPYLNLNFLTTKTCLKHRGAMFDDVKTF